MIEMCHIAADNIAGLDVLNRSTIDGSVAGIVDPGKNRLIVTDQNSLSLFDSNEALSIEKKLVLYGSEGNVKVFSSEMPFGGNGNVSDSPRAVVQAVTPIVLSSRISDCCECDCGGCELNFPECVANCFCGNFVVPNCGRKVLITLGLFTIVQLERRVQMLIPAYDFCIPGKECVTTTDDPCEVFKHIKFPTNEFFPPEYNKKCKE